MKRVLFGIAVILFAMVVWMADVWGTDCFALPLGLTGLVIAGTGAFTKDR